MAHELAHVAQQDGADAVVQRKSLEDGTASAEGEADAAAGGVLARLYGVMRKTTAGVAGQLKGKTDLALQRCPGGTPDRVPDLGGAEHKEWSVDDFIAMWEKKHGRKMTDEEKQILAHGCIGITALNLGRGNHNPPLGLSFSSFEQARKVQAAVNDIVKAKPAADKLGEMIAANPQLADLKNVLAAMPADPDPTKWRAYVFSKRFFSRQTGTWDERKDGDPTKFQPDKNGQVDMTDDQNVGRSDVKKGPGNYMINFDYGWYDEESGSWLHANHADPDMKVYQSTLDYYSRPLRNFDRQVFCVAFARVGK